MNELEKMQSGNMYNAADLKLVYLRDKTARKLHKFNKRCYHEIDIQNRILKDILNTNGNFCIKPPFFCDYGFNIYIGKNEMLN